MTALQSYELVLTELNKVKAPSLLLDDYVYFINKGVQQYINKAYHNFDVNQQKLDDLRVLKASSILKPTLSSSYGASKLHKNIHDVILPDDYFHLLNCVAEYKVVLLGRCEEGETFEYAPVKRLPSTAAAQVFNNYYFKPTHKEPYYYFQNVGETVDQEYRVTLNSLPVSVLNSNGAPTIIKPNNYYIPDSELVVTINSDTTLHQLAATTWRASRIENNLIIKQSNLFSTNLPHIKEGTIVKFESSDNFALGKIIRFDSSGMRVELLNNLDIDETLLINIVFYKGDYKILGNRDKLLVDKQVKLRYGNTSKVKMEIRFGDNPRYVLNNVYVDYLKAPEYIKLTQYDIDNIEDTSQLLEFPDYVCYEIINEVVKLVLENASDPRLQTHIPVNQSITQSQQINK